MTTMKNVIRQLGVDSAYLLVGFPLGLVSFVLVITLLSTGAGMLITIVGLPILVAAVYAARAFADVERLRLRPVLNRPVPRPRYHKAPPGSGAWRKLFIPLGDGQSWLDLLHAMFHWILGTIGFVFVVTWWSGALGGITYVFWDWALPRPDTNKDLNVLIGISDSWGARIGLHTLIGVVFLLTLPLVMRIFALLSAQFSRVLLSGIADIRHQVTELSEQRDSAGSAEATALRRREPAIH